MAETLILASGSITRQRMLRNSGVEFSVDPARIDEAAIRLAMTTESEQPRDIADALAEHKARRIAARHPDALVLGCDQVLEFQRRSFGKADTIDELRTILRDLSGNQHNLYSAAVLYSAGQPVWRHVGRARLFMRVLSNDYIDGYLDRNWDQVRNSVGGYHIEAEGVRLFQRIEGDYFTILGLPLVELLSYLTLRRMLPG